MSDLLSRGDVTAALLSMGGDLTDPDCAELANLMLNMSEGPPPNGPLAQKYEAIQRENDRIKGAVDTVAASRDGLIERCHAFEAHTASIAAELSKLHKLLRNSPRAKTKAQIAGTLRNLAIKLRRDPSWTC